MIPPWPLTVAREEEIKPQNKKKLSMKRPLRIQSIEKKSIKNDGSPLLSASSDMPEGEGTGPAVMEP
jgi:hypothetical protein